MNGTMRRLTVLLATLLVASGLTAVQAQATAGPGRQSYTGTIDGAEYRVETPANWNGTLLLYSHGYMPEGFPSTGIALTNRPEPFGRTTEQWLLDHGYALAASNVSPPTGYHVPTGLRDQIKLLDWFEDNIGMPRHTIATGQSLGAALAVGLAERHPDRFHGVLTTCAGYDPLGLFNAVLDMTFVIKTLLAPGEDIDLVRHDDPDASMQALQSAIDRALLTPEGRARLALAASVNNVTGWYSARVPTEPATPEMRIAQQAQWLKNAYVMLGTLGRADIERHAGGNPSWNTGINYAGQLERSAQTELVREAYGQAGLNLSADLATLAKAPRIGADQAAVDWLTANRVPTGELRVPMVSLHTTGDGGAVPDQERWYAEQVREHGSGDVRGLYVRRGGHCSVTGAEEVSALVALDQRLRTGSWPVLAPEVLNATAGSNSPAMQFAFDFSTFTDGPATPAFVNFTPPKFLRPSH